MRQTRQTAHRLANRLASEGVDIVHTHWLPQQLIAGWMRRRGFHSVWQINNNMNPNRLGGLGPTLNHRLARWGADLLLPASDFIAGFWQGSGVPMRTVRNAAEPMFEEPNTLEPTPIRCLVAARLEHGKGHHLAVEAVLAAREAGLEVRLDIAGGPMEDNPYADQLRERIASNQAEDAIRLLGFVSDLRARHQQYHLGLQCRIDPEPCSLWVCETLVDGLPLIASDSGGTPELVVDGETGRLFPAGDAETLGERLIELAGEPEALNRMRHAAFARGRAEFTADQFVKRTYAAYWQHLR
jgi:glycosyltransferase involved in cell wall biosynthesis